MWLFIGIIYLIAVTKHDAPLYLYGQGDRIRWLRFQCRLPKFCQESKICRCPVSALHTHTYTLDLPLHKILTHNEHIGSQALFNWRNMSQWLMQQSNCSMRCMIATCAVEMQLKWLLRSQNLMSNRTKYNTDVTEPDLQ